MLRATYDWIDRNILSLGRDMRLSYLPPLMVYMAAGVSGLTGIVTGFFVKDYLSLSAEFLAALGFWAGIPWALKMPLGHLVDLIWRWKGLLVYLGASLIACSLLVMVGLIGHREAMTAILPANVWYVIGALLAPVGYVIQDAVADAMTVEAVPFVDERGHPVEAGARKLMHTTMQTLGRVAIIGGSVLVSFINLWMFSGVTEKPVGEVVKIYEQVYWMAMVIPLISVLGVVAAGVLKRRQRARLRALGFDERQVEAKLSDRGEPTTPNWMILGGSLVFVIFTLSTGLGGNSYKEEIVFLGSLAIVMFLIVRLTRALAPAARATLIGTAVVIFMFRATPGVGPGVSWWMIDKLKFDQHFFSVLDLIGSTLTLVGMFIFRRFMAERSIAYVIGFLTLVGFLLSLPMVAMYYGLHEWTAAHTGGVVDARFIALVNTALESPLGQISMIPMLAWIANSAPANLKATYFAVMASFTNLALSASQLGTKYLNEIFVVTREITDPATGAVQVPEDYSRLGELMLVQMGIYLLVPFAAILFSRVTRFRSA
ncbi:MAG: hypothetical protein NFCOHLIN_02809 [Gammaproteobacteria bacterium]|nr:hypothetical protein [Gammaproteobacteria bacterium]